MSLEGELARVYDLADGTGLLAGAGFSRDGEVLVGFAFGQLEPSKDLFINDLVDRAFFSFSQY